MTEALIDYLSFLAKTVTLVVAIGALLIVLIKTRKGIAGDDGESLEIKDLNERFRFMGRAVKEASLSKKALRELDKAEHKAEKRRMKEGSEDRSRVFVVDFHGDIKATEVAALRELVTIVLMEARDGDSVVLRLDNAGGMVSEHGLAASQLARLRRAKIPLTVSVDKVAASGGYLMACVADRIVAAPFAVVGSIGVLVELPNFHRLLEQHGVDFELHTAGEHKRTVTLFGENTDADRKKLQEQLEMTHRLFKGFIVEYRPHIELQRVATGEYWHASDAVELGLVDEIMTSDDLLLERSEEADILQLKYSVHKTPMERLLSGFHSALSRGAGMAWTRYR